MFQKMVIVEMWTLELAFHGCYTK